MKNCSSSCIQAEVNALMAPSKKIIKKIKAQSKPRQKRARALKPSSVEVDFKKLFKVNIQILYKYKVITKIELFKQIENEFKDNRYFDKDKKLYQCKGYGRVME